MKWWKGDQTPMTVFLNRCENGHEWKSYCLEEFTEVNLEKGGLFCMHGAKPSCSQFNKPDLSDACLSRRVTKTFLGNATREQVMDSLTVKRDDEDTEI